MEHCDVCKQPVDFVSNHLGFETITGRFMLSREACSTSINIGVCDPCIEQFELTKWRDASERSGDAETHIISLIALGEPVDWEREWNIPPSRKRLLREMVQSDAKAIASRWVAD